MALLTLKRDDKRLVDLPSSWSNAGRREQLQRVAAESFSNLVAIAVADSGENFQLYDALRPLEEQEQIFYDRYRVTNWTAKKNSSDRWHQGKIWRKVKGANAAAPGMSNHGSGLAVDIHHAGIQKVFREKGPAWGWSWAEGKKNGEAWHFVFVGGNRYAARGWLDHAWVQKIVGAEVDGKIGVGTVAKIKAWQKAHGLEADGIVGPGTKKAMQGKGAAAPVTPAAPELSTGGTTAPKPQTLASAVDGIFPWADSATQWWDEKYSNTNKGGKPTGLLHSTETGTWPGYGSGGQAPHMTILFDEDARGIIPRQHFKATRPSRALANRAGGVETNNWTVFQIELIGSCDRAFATKHGYPYLPDLLATDWARDALAAVIAAVSSTLNIPLTSSVTWRQYPSSYGEKASQRLSDAAWNAYTGWLGHQHVPENDHGDPGDLPVAAILAAANGTPGAVVTPAPSPPSTGGTMPTGKAALMALIAAPDFPLLRTPGNLCYYGGDSKQTSVSGKVPNSLVPGEITGTGKTSGATGLKAWQKQMNARGYSLDEDGRYGDATEKAAKNLQRLADLDQDGAIGPDTWHAAWLLPVVA